TDNDDTAFDSIADNNAVNPLSNLLQTDTSRFLGEAIDQLPEREKQVISLYYYDEMTMKEIGMVLGITESRVSQLRTQAILRLKGHLASEQVSE
ncbi:MAG: sigma-70 family RNA polymerase sigma factor, partial [Nitrospirota bacterium]